MRYRERLTLSEGDLQHGTPVRRVAYPELARRFSAITFENLSVEDFVDRKGNITYEEKRNLALKI